jgi:hypothetical protein
MRRGSGTGGRKSPRSGWPSGPIVDWRGVSRKYSQCQSGGSGSPIRDAGSLSSSVALIARTGKGAAKSSVVWVFPTQARKSSNDISSIFSMT